MQVGIPYILTGPDGTRAVFNDPTDSDFVGYLNPDTGITGLLDSAGVRESVSNLVEADGSVQGNNYLSRKTGTIQGILMPDSPTNTNVRESKLKRATRGLRAASPATLTFTPDGSVTRQIQIYRQGSLALSGRRPKTFVIPCSTPDVYQYAATESSFVIVPSAISGELGFGSPFSSPITNSYHSTGSNVVSNIGDAETWPRIRIDGPVVNPVVTSTYNSLVQQIGLTYTLNAGEFMLINTKPGSRSVLFNGTLNRYSSYAANFATNSWWSLQPGSNQVQLFAQSYSAGAQVTVYWRHAWE